MLLAVAIAAVVGALVGIVIGRATAGRDGATAVPEAAPPSDDVATILAEAADHLEIGVVISSESGRTVFANRAASAMKGTHGGVLVDEHVDRILATARAGEPVATTVELHGPPRLTLALVAEPMPNGAAVATIHDVSAQVRTDRMRTDFVANISHELKTPVGAIAVLAEALVDETDMDVVRRVADRMIEEAHRAVRTIDDLLELSAIESDRRDHHEVVDLGAVVEAAIGRGRAADQGRGVRIDAFDAPEPVLVRADGRQLVSALGNLVENAVKYSHENGVVEVRARVDERFVELVVADHGVGIPERDLDRIFERFYRVDRARQRRTGGTGLGLAIVRHVATNHGGDVSVSSDEGEGSTFVFRLPAALVVPAGPEDVAPGPDVSAARPRREDSRP